MNKYRFNRVVQVFVIRKLNTETCAVMLVTGAIWPPPRANLPYTDIEYFRKKIVLVWSLIMLANIHFFYLKLFYFSEVIYYKQKDNI